MEHHGRKDILRKLPDDMNTQNTISHGLCKKNNKMFCCMISPSSEGVNMAGSITCGDNDYHLSYSRQYASPDGASQKGLSCKAKEEKYQAVCQTVSGKKTGTTTATPTPNGWQTGYTAYSLE